MSDDVTSSGAPTVLELQRMALEQVLASFDLDAVQSCTSCNTQSCDRPRIDEEVVTA